MSNPGKRVVTVVTGICMAAALCACQKQEGPAEKAGKEIDRAVDKAGRQIEKAGDKVRDAVKGDGK